MIFEKKQYQEKQCNVRRNNSYKERVRLYMISFCSILFTQYLITCSERKAISQKWRKKTKSEQYQKFVFIINSESSEVIYGQKKI